MSEGGGKKAYSVDAMNLTSVQRIDPCAVAIVDKSTHAALYSFDAVKEEWTKTDIEGPLLIYRRADKPTHSMIIANRQSLSDHIEPITPTLRIWEKSPYIFFKKTEENEITGLWFYERDDCVRIYKLLTKLLADDGTHSPPIAPTIQDNSFDVLSLLSRAHTHSAPPSSSDQRTPIKHQTDVTIESSTKSSNTFEMPVMLQKLLCEESGLAKRTIPPKGALSADQIEKQLVHGDTKQQLLDRIALFDGKLAANCSSASLAALSTTAVGGSDSGTLPDDAISAEHSISASNYSNRMPRNAQELKRSCSADDTSTAPLVPLTKEQMLQALTHLLKTDDDFVVQLHRAYVDSLNYRLGL